MSKKVSPLKILEKKLEKVFVHLTEATWAAEEVENLIFEMAAKEATAK